MMLTRSSGLSVAGISEMSDDLTEESFNKLLAWLDPDRDQAAEKFIKIQLRLIRIFSANGCSDPERLATETFSRIQARIDWLIENYVGDPLHYFCAVARNQVKEDYRERTAVRAVRSENPMVKPDEDEESNRLYQCLDQCMGTFNQHSQRLLIDYYQEQGNEKIVNRRKLAEASGITLRALRLRVFHLRSRLKICMEICLQDSAVHETI